MQSLDNSQVRDYDKQQNILDAVVGFSFNTTSGYTTPPTVAFSGGAGTGAAATAVVKNGGVVEIKINNAGTGYTSAPTIALTGGGGSNATATAVVAGGVITAINVTNTGDSKKITVTDNTVYPSGDSRKGVNVSIFDKRGGKKEYHLAAGESTKTFDILADKINPVEGLDMLVTVASTKGAVKDGGAYNVGIINSNGNFVMEY